MGDLRVGGTFGFWHGATVAVPGAGSAAVAAARAWQTAPVSGRPIIFVTGGSRGIGAATATMAAGRGYDVAITFVRDRAAADDVVAECVRAGAHALAVRCDVAVESDVVAAFEEVRDQLGVPAAVVVNAGTLHRAARLDEFDIDRLRDVVAVNVVGAIVTAREAVRCMSTRHGGAGGSIVTVSSAASYLGLTRTFPLGVYSASKATGVGSFGWRKVASCPCGRYHECCLSCG